MSDGRDHTNHINIWFEEAAKGLVPDQLLRLAESAMGALWMRAYHTLGEITVMAVTDRVVSTAAEKFPEFNALKVTKTGLDWRELRKQHQDFNKLELTSGVQFLIAEFIQVIGNLTAEVLMPALQSELLKVAGERPATGEKRGKKQS